MIFKRIPEGCFWNLKRHAKLKYVDSKLGFLCLQGSVFSLYSVRLMDCCIHSLAHLSDSSQKLEFNTLYYSLSRLIWACR